MRPRTHRHTDARDHNTFRQHNNNTAIVDDAIYRWPAETMTVAARLGNESAMSVRRKTYDPLDQANSESVTDVMQGRPGGDSPAPVLDDMMTLS